MAKHLVRFPKFTFNQRQLENLIKLRKAKKIVFSVCAIPEDGKHEMYLAAQAYDESNAPITTTAVLKGCPCPPCWETEDDKIKIEHASLAFAPRYAIDKAVLKEELTANEYLLDKDRLVEIELSAKTVTPEADAAGAAATHDEQEIFLSLNIRKDSIRRKDLIGGAGKTITTKPLKSLEIKAS